MKRFWIFLFLLFLPTQLGRHFWPDWTRVLGIRVDYLSPTLYFLDLIWLVFFLNEIKKIISNNQTSSVPNNKQSRNFNKQKIRRIIKKYWWMGVLIGINILVADRSWLTVYGWGRVFQMIWMGRYFFENKKMFKEEVVRVLPIWIVFESFLGLGQIIWGGSLEGIFYWLGERRFSYSSIGTAQMAVMGRGMVRAYGTFSHPNSMAGFLLVAELLWLNFRREKNKLWWWMVFWSGLVGIILSGSRTVWVLSVMVLIYNFIFFIFRKDKKWWGFLVMFVGIFMLVLAGVNSNYMLSDWLGGWDRESLLKRWNLNIIGFNMIRNTPLFGVGLKNFLVELPEYQKDNTFFWLQPVHNIFLLLLSEIGILGVWLLTRLRLRFDLKNKIFRSIVIVLLVTGMVDHYWLTLIQNNWLLVVLGVFLLR